MNTGTHSLLLEAKAQGILGIIKKFRSIFYSFSKFALQEAQKGTLIFLVIVRKKNQLNVIQFPGSKF